MKKLPALLSTLPLIVLFLTTAGCQSDWEARKNSPSYNTRMAERLLKRSKTQLAENDFTPAISDVIRAEMLCEDDELLADIHMHREDILNHVQLQAVVENGDTLKYTLLYKREEIFYPIGNMHVRFSFVKGSGIMEESARTNASGTATSRIQKLNALRTKFLIESVAVVFVKDETVRIEELRYDYVVANHGNADHVDLELITDIVAEAIHVSLEILDILLDDFSHD
jgi:hypothetical protein